MYLGPHKRAFPNILLALYRSYMLDLSGYVVSGDISIIVYSEDV